MQAHDYIRSTNQNDTKNSSIFEEREEQTKKRQTIPKFGNVRNRNRRKKKKEREKNYAYREEIPDLVRCYGAGVTWCFVARLFRSQSPR